MARIPGFRPGKAPVTLVRRRFADDIQGEVVQSLVPEYLEKALDEKKLVPVTRPEIDQVHFKEGEPLKFRAVFEVLPEFDLGDYKNLQVQIDEIQIGDEQVNKTLEEMRERAATYVPVEGRPAKDGDYVLMKLMGIPVAAAIPFRRTTFSAISAAKRPSKASRRIFAAATRAKPRSSSRAIPDDYPDPKLAGKTYNYSVDVQDIKEKKLPELNDEFAKDAAGEQAGITTLDELRKKIRENLDAAQENTRQTSQAREKILDALVKQHDFPVPEALIESQMDVRLERVVRSLAAQGVDPRAVNVDWVSLAPEPARQSGERREGRTAARSHRRSGKNRCDRRRRGKGDREPGRTEWRIGNSVARSLDKARSAR